MQAVGEPINYYRANFEHLKRDDPFWQASDVSARIGEVQAAVHQISGWQDFFLRETLADYESLRAAGRTPYLTIGPWAHTELSVSLEALREGIYWFDAQLKGDTSNLRVNPVRIYVVGSGEWRRMETWPPPSSATQWFLQPERRLALHTATEVNTPDRYVYDPARPTPALGGAFFSARQGGVRDNRALEARNDVLTFTSSVLDSDLEIMGTPRATLYVQSSLQYTDFFVRLCDVYPDGRSLNVTDGLLRVAPGVGDPQPDGSLRIELPLWPTAANSRADTVCAYKCRVARTHAGAETLAAAKTSVRARTWPARGKRFFTIPCTRRM